MDLHLQRFHLRARQLGLEARRLQLALARQAVLLGVLDRADDGPVGQERQVNLEEAERHAAWTDDRADDRRFAASFTTAIPRLAGMWTANGLASRRRDNGTRAPSSRMMGAMSVHSSQSTSATAKARGHDSDRPA